ncbi:hypothetical protein LCGC14_1736190 [marine sediment metagenome]|uniref:Uncharacterized protein n=1 Tax=marine sediment metagenome TaxID=412755 RepID=A0A0F9K7R1_9ZZZZ
MSIQIRIQTGRYRYVRSSGDEKSVPTFLTRTFRTSKDAIRYLRELGKKKGGE